MDCSIVSYGQVADATPTMFYNLAGLRGRINCELNCFGTKSGLTPNVVSCLSLNIGKKDGESKVILEFESIALQGKSRGKLVSCIWRTDCAYIARKDAT